MSATSVLELFANKVRALHPPTRDEGSPWVWCGGLCYEPGTDYDDYGHPADWPCDTAKLVFTVEEIAEQEQISARFAAEQEARKAAREAERAAFINSPVNQERLAQYRADAQRRKAEAEHHLNTDASKWLRGVT